MEKFKLFAFLLCSAILISFVTSGVLSAVLAFPLVGVPYIVLGIVFAVKWYAPSNEKEYYIDQLLGSNNLYYAKL